MAHNMKFELKGTAPTADWRISMSVKMNIPFSPPDISEDEINEVVDTLKSGWITTGPKTK